MPVLKDRLTQKIKRIESCAESTSESEIKNEPENNLILFKSNQTDSFVPDFAITLSEARNRLTLLQEFVKEMMVIDVDYGMIPGCSKPSLFKSGAEKLCDIYGLSKHVEIINRVEDWNNKIFHYEVKATLVNKRSGYTEAEGIGSCNNREKKYATQDAFNVINTIIKMAKKRALVDAVLSATRSSALFTQDVEDFENEPKPPSTVSQTKQTSTQIEAAPINQNTSTSNEAAIKAATRNQLAYIMKLVAEKKIIIGELNSLLQRRYMVKESKLLSTQQADDFIKFLMTYKPKA